MFPHPLPATLHLATYRMAHSCSACMASLEPEDGHDRCPSCLGRLWRSVGTKFEHLREVLTLNACMSCSCMPRALRVARITEVERLAAAYRHLSLSHPPPDQFGRSRRLEGAMAMFAPPNRRTRNRLSSKVDRLTADRGMMKSPLGPSAWARCRSC
ncbi:hypothetical protein CesoFtcFv8_010848 [Champsocephalus esox]|uniref:Uncharacterized protein n=1 Tax=Champsocephalus esox TaxID=159716 RepID=A0AAN8GWL0_9TELE|nr:hypothetical protein CesoFtcFv8_010848 [Champsocephalus esox]